MKGHPMRGHEPSKPRLGYSVYVICENCDFRDEIELELGALVTRTPCPNCGNQTLERQVEPFRQRRNY